MITKLNSVNYANSNPNSQVAFKGGRFNVIKYALNPFKKVNQHKLMSKLFLSKDVLQLEKQQGINNPVLGVNKPFNRHKAGFLYRLVNKFNGENFYENLKNKNLQEKRQLVYDMYHKVKYPTKVHKIIAESFDYNLSETNQIFELMNQDKSKLSLVKKLLTKDLDNVLSMLPGRELIEILSSDNCKILNKNYSKAEKYITDQTKKADFSISRVPQLLESFAERCK